MRAGGKIGKIFLLVKISIQRISPIDLSNVQKVLSSIRFIHCIFI